MEKINKSNIEILIPTLNEEGNIQETIKALQSRNFKNITIIDDNSSDNTIQISKDLGCNVIENIDKKRLGFGLSLIKAIQSSKFEYCCIFDGDNSFDPDSLLEMIKKLEEGNDFVFCSRYKHNNVSPDDTYVSKFGNFFFTKTINILFNIMSSDVLFLYVMGKKENFRSLKLESKDFRICIEILLKSYLNFKCDEILSLERKRKFGESKVNTINDGIKILLDIIKYYFKKFFNKKLI